MRSWSEMTEFYIPSCGRGRIHCVRWEPEGEPKAILQVVHGISEYVERYGDFAAYLNHRGILVVGEDHMGHGKSVEGELAPVYFYGGWTNAVDDTYALLKKTRKENPGVPYIILGHSMGSFMTRTLLYRHRDSGIAGAAICGTGWQPPALLRAGKLAAGAIIKKQGETAPSTALDRLMFGAYNRGYGQVRTAFDWLNRDTAAVDAYIQDPMCGATASVGLVRDMLTGLGMNQDPKNLRNMDPDIPVYFLAGSEDPVGSWGKGVLRTAQEFLKAGVHRVETHLYPGGRHEILNEINKEEVYEDLYKWIQREVL